MLVNALNQRVIKRNSHKTKPHSFTLIVHPGYNPHKSFTQKRTGLPALLQNKKIIASAGALALVTALIAVCFPVFSQKRDVKEFVFPEQSKSIVGLLHAELAAYYTEAPSQPADTDGLKTLKTTVYKVKNGDTLTGIASRFNLNLGTIIGFNNITDARSIQVGTGLTIPNHDGLLYTVKSGDSLSRISQDYNISLNSLLDWNRLETSVLIKGQRLFLPGAALSEKTIAGVLGKLFIYPTHGRLTSGFGWRNSPFTGVRELHRGVDLANNSGTTVVASRTGRISKIGYDAVYGNFIIIAHEDGFHTLYGHLKKILVSKGTYVKQGQRIGLMGTSGLTTGPHLHFGIFKNGQAVNPFIYIK
jgi:murein DD-endopeptidase MepM/ murein hydrolase activator NlpD